MAINHQKGIFYDEMLIWANHIRINNKPKPSNMKKNILLICGSLLFICIETILCIRYKAIDVVGWQLLGLIILIVLICVIQLLILIFE